MDREDLKDCRMLVTVLLPKGADDKKAFKGCPKGTLFAADYFRDEDLMNAERMKVFGMAGGIAIHRALEDGRG